jgi:hypothetical protein
MLVAILAHGWVSARESMLERVRPAMSPDVLRFHARQIIRNSGYGDRLDSEQGFLWGRDFANWVERHGKPVNWSEVAKGRAPVLRYWYRESAEPLPGIAFHDDLLTLGVTTPDDPPGITSGMIYVELDPQGRLIEFRSMPAQKLDEPVSTASVDWSPLFRAAAIEPDSLKADAPRWNFLEASDTRAAWIGNWPGSTRPLRIEAAALGGKPVAFVLIGPWATASRMPSASSVPTELLLVVMIGITVPSGICRGPPTKPTTRAWRPQRGLPRPLHVLLRRWRLARHACIHSRHRPDRLFSGGGSNRHLYATLVWTMYLALEPFVRRYWPQTLISWTNLQRAGQDGPLTDTFTRGSGLDTGGSCSLIHRVYWARTKPIMRRRTC